MKASPLKPRPYGLPLQMQRTVSEDVSRKSKTPAGIFAAAEWKGEHAPEPGLQNGSSGKILALMNREYHKGYSQELHREMEMLVFGHAGTPLLVFPTSMGRFFEYEDRGMIGVLSGKIERGELQVFCPDAIDTESWYNKSAHPRIGVLRHLQSERTFCMNCFPTCAGETSPRNWR